MCTISCGYSGTVHFTVSSGYSGLRGTVRCTVDVSVVDIVVLYSVQPAVGVVAVVVLYSHN